VLWEDQQRINTFSKLVGRLQTYEERLKAQKQEKEYYDDVAMELELVDEDEMIQYKIGDTFVYLKQSEVMERLSADTENLEKELEGTQEKHDKTVSEMSDLKTLLYAKFGSSINLES
jgi:prefoldin subunit 4